jgi:hypothetical protein
MRTLIDDRPVPLRPDWSELAFRDRRSLMRAVTAKALSPRPADYLRRTWESDRLAAEILKAAVTQTTTADFPAVQTVRVLPMLAPAAASSRLLALGTTIDLSGVSTVKIPSIAAGGLPAAVFVQESKPGPVVNLVANAATLGPARKVLIMAALSAELQEASGDTAATIIGQALATAAERSLDAALFSSNAATVSAPAGILYGVAAIPSAGGTGAEGVADDLALIAEAIGNKNVSVEDLAIVTTPALATKIKVLASPKFTNPVFSSAALADGTVVGIVPQALVSGFADAIELDSSVAATVHYEDANPQDIVGGASPGTPASPTRSAFQTNSLIVRCSGWAAWTCLPGGVASVTGADW